MPATAICRDCCRLDDEREALWRRRTLIGWFACPIRAVYLKQRVWLWNGIEEQALYWHLLVRREIHGTKLKFCPANTRSGAG
jgi:hypothetical protein